jgi:hypothetical protein
MKRSMCGVIALFAVTSLWACNGDPTESIRTGEKIIATPTSVVVEQGTTEFVTVQLVDGQGNQLGADFQAQDIAAGISVTKDETYLATTNGERVPTSARFAVGGVDPGVTSQFVVAAGGATLTVPVRVVNRIPGSNAVATAPVIALPAVGSSISFFDKPDWATGLDLFGAPASFYQFTVPPEAGGVTIEANWAGDADIDLFVCPPPADDDALCDFTGATGAHPEHGTFVLAPGPYLLVAELFDPGEGAPVWVQFTFTTDPPAPPPPTP